MDSPGFAGVCLVTPRLLLRPILDDDFSWLAALHGDPTAMARTRGGVQGPDAVRALLDACLRSWADDGIGMWVMIRREDDAPIGVAGVLDWRVEHGSFAARVVVDPSVWGFGYAVEAMTAALDDVFGRAGVDRLVAFATADNSASDRALKRLRFGVEDRVEHADATVVRYGLDRETWLR